VTPTTDAAAAAMISRREGIPTVLIANPFKVVERVINGIPANPPQ
jgi:hypothetical protein